MVGSYLYRGSECARVQLDYPAKTCKEARAAAALHREAWAQSETGGWRNADRLSRSRASESVSYREMHISALLGLCLG